MYDSVIVKAKALLKNFRQNYELYLFVLLPLIYVVIFCYVPMYGVQIAFRKFDSALGITGSPWVGFAQFKRFFNSYQFSQVLKNTLGISFYQLAASFPAPIILALMLNEVAHRKFKKFTQTVTYAPYFISTVTVTGMILIFLSPRSGIIPMFLQTVGIKPQLYIAEPSWFKTIYVVSGVWQATGFASILYIAALSSVDPALYESAMIDGVSKLKKIFYIDLPVLRPTIVIMLILSFGSLMSVGFEKVFLLQNDLNLSSSEVISTYTYKIGLQGGQFSYSAAIGLFNSAINFVMLVAVNFIARRLGESSLW